jgi:hypothetical protein
MASLHTPGAFLFGLRLMAIDGSTEQVPDTPENAAVFGRHRGRRGESAFPQVGAIYLAECGTHAVVDAGFWPCHTSPRVVGFRMLRSVASGMLVMWDRGLHDYDMVRGVLQRHSQVLGRLPATVTPKVVRRLPDGSYLAYLYPTDYRRRKRGEHLLLRIIDYTITDPAVEVWSKHRLLTTLLDHQHVSIELACAYHERWGIELVVDEIDTHQRLAVAPCAA